MAVIWIPPLLRNLTGGASQISVDAHTVGDAVTELEQRFPGIHERLVAEDRLRPNIALVVDGVNSKRGLKHELDAASEVHFVPALSGGSARRGD
jgi:molybdopterin converting factor small subunit